MNRFLQLYAARKAMATTEFKGRGARRIRCPRCQVPQTLCICQDEPATASHSAFVLLMHSKEVLRPSNSGRFIADVLNDTYAYIWSRTEANLELEALCGDPKWQPYVVFQPSPDTPRDNVHHDLSAAKGKRPLFILLDGSWREARRMYQHSPWLHALPMLSILSKPSSEYGLRQAPLETQLATAEVACELLNLANDTHCAQRLSAQFSAFRQATLAGRSQAQYAR